MPACRAVLCIFLLALMLACSVPPSREDVIMQARAGGQIAFDVVKLDDNVLATLQAHRPLPFDRRFKQYLPPPELKIAVGDTIAVMIWEAASGGLFGNSLTELSFPAGAGSDLRAPPSPLNGVPSTPLGLAATPEQLARLYGGAAGAALTANAGGQQRKLEQLLDLANQSGRPGTLIPDQQVGSDGAISVPYAGRIRVAGMTPEAVERRIMRLLGPKALDPQALVLVRRSAQNAVSVAGESIGGARVPLSPGGDRLLQVIAAAGGSQAPVHDTFVRLSRGSTTASVPLATLVADPREDIFARPGDVLTLIQRPQTFSVFGASGKNAAFTFTSDRMSLAEALAKAGGLRDDRADPRAVFLFRYEPVAVVRALGQPVASDAHDGFSPIAYRLDLRQARSYLIARRFPVHDKDVIFVADAESQPLYNFFQALQLVTGPVVSAVATCQYVTC